MAAFTQDLVDAARAYSSCAKAIVLNAATPSHPTAVESEQVIGFGIASEWLRRAVTMTEVAYRRRIRGSIVARSKKRQPGITELVRFNMVWYAMNALIARSSIVGLLGTPPSKTELSRFRFMFANSGLQPTTVASLTATLHAILEAKHVTRMPTYPAGTSVTALEAIFEKYTPPEFQAFGVGKEVKKALASKNLGNLDLPTLIYLMRNWIVHASMMDGAFGSMVRFRMYTDTILEGLALIHVGSSQALLSKL